jgi:hypothetical protein
MFSDVSELIIEATIGGCCLVTRNYSRFFSALGIYKPYYLIKKSDIEEIAGKIVAKLSPENEVLVMKEGEPDKRQSCKFTIISHNGKTIFSSKNFSNISG